MLNSSPAAPALVPAASTSPEVEGEREPALYTDRLVKDFDGYRAVAGLNLRVERGEILGILGPNGAGKSTTMKCCAGLAVPTWGAVRILGIDPLEEPVEVRRHIGYVPDIGGLYPRLTGWEHLELAASLRKLPESWVPRARELVETLGLTTAAGRRTSTYSHGMGRKLCLAVALMGSPELLLLDEPFDGVDPAGAAAARQLILEHARAGAGVLVSTHLLATSELLCDRLTVVRAGSQLATGTAEQLREWTESATLEAAYLTLMRVTGGELGASG